MHACLGAGLPDRLMVWAQVARVAWMLAPRPGSTSGSGSASSRSLGASLTRSPCRYIIVRRGVTKLPHGFNHCEVDVEFPPLFHEWPYDKYLLPQRKYADHHLQN